MHNTLLSSETDNMKYGKYVQQVLHESNYVYVYTYRDIHCFQTNR